MAREDWEFSHNLALEAEWTPGLREIFEYRDLVLSLRRRAITLRILCARKAHPIRMKSSTGMFTTAIFNSLWSSTVGPSSNMRAKACAVLRKGM